MSSFADSMIDTPAEHCANKVWYSNSMSFKLTKKQQRVVVNLVLALTVMVLASFGLVYVSPDGEILPAPPKSALESAPSPVAQVLGQSTTTLPGGELESAVVVRVIDGDTIQLQDGRTLRYIGIDTPETKHPTVGKECYGDQASRRNLELVEGQTVQLEKDVSETDRYQRLLRYVWLNDRMINEQLVAEGYATAVSFPPDIRHQAELQAAEQEAREAGLGLWSACQLPTIDASPTPTQQ